VTHDEDCETIIRQRIEQLEKRHLVGHIEEGRRLIEYERIPLLSESACNSHPLPLASGELVCPGIGKMVDNPRYVDVKMGGPTPPHTYDLKMRETRFHGVEALRMLPVDGKNRNGRNGLLTHSYLLRGGRAESHGCVAFKDYARFLSAFKQGKVRQLVVVPSGGRSSVRLASAGNSI